MRHFCWSASSLTTAWEYWSDVLECYWSLRKVRLSSHRLNVSRWGFECVRSLMSMPLGSELVEICSDYSCSRSFVQFDCLIGAKKQAELLLWRLCLDIGRITLSLVISVIMSHPFCLDYYCPSSAVFASWCLLLPYLPHSLVWKSISFESSLGSRSLWTRLSCLILSDISSASFVLLHFLSFYREQMLRVNVPPEERQSSSSRSQI